jgi:2-oxoglutarate dehydrogenase E1 component
MTPKSLLRNPLAVSTLNELADGEFQLVIPELDKLDANKVDRVILTSGKIYYELLQYRRDAKLNNVAIIRLEQLYPFPEEVFRKVMSVYANTKDIIWCQEEPQNQGAWTTISPFISPVLKSGQTLRYVGRQSSASPAVGYAAVHQKEQEEIVIKALTK